MVRDFIFDAGCKWVIMFIREPKFERAVNTEGISSKLGIELMDFLVEIRKKRFPLHD